MLNWNGTAWSSVPTPAPSGSTPNWAFKAVAASSASDAWAVGVQSAGTKIHDSLYEHWNGSAWSVVSGPNEGVLNAVVDFSPTNAWAFADLNTLHWNGTAWSVVSGVYGVGLSVSADGPNDIWGIDRNDIVSHYNGTSWSYYTLTAPGGTPVMESVDALSPADVWSGGATTANTSLLERFNGTSWRVMALPSSLAATGIPAITAKSDSDVWAFGYGYPPVIANWNGSSWTTSTDPLPSGTEVQMGSAASSPSHVWMFGTYLSASAGWQPLILSHS